VTRKLSINSKRAWHSRCSKCLPFAATQASGASLQGEDTGCGGVAAAHYGGMGTSRPMCHRQRSEAVAYATLCLCRCKRRRSLTSDTTLLFERLFLSSMSIHIHRCNVLHEWRFTVGSRTFTASGAAVWNDLPAHVTAAPSLAVFRQRLKTFLFSRSYPDIVA